MSHRKLLRSIKLFLLEDDGPTAVEYAILLALIIVTASAGIQVLVTETNNSLTNSSNMIAN